MQPDLKTGEIKPLMIAVKNKAVGNWYSFMACIGQSVRVNTNGTAGDWDSGDTSTNTAGVYDLGLQLALLYFSAGTDTTTPTVSTMGAIVAPTNNGSQANSVLLPTPNSSASSVQWSGTWNANAFGSGPTIILGEFGISIGYSGMSGTGSLIRRIAVADGNFSPLTVTTSLPLTVTVVVSNE